MARSAILLIGTEKTGTTTLQHFLAANRPALAERGFLYPSFCGAINHTGLAAYALAPAKTDPLRAPYGADVSVSPRPASKPPPKPSSPARPPSSSPASTATAASRRPKKSRHCAAFSTASSTRSASASTSAARTRSR